MLSLVFGKLDYFDNNIYSSQKRNSTDFSINQSATPISLIEYREIDEPCVALTIIGENRLTDTEVFIKRSAKFSFKAIFSTIVLTFLNLFI